MIDHLSLSVSDFARSKAFYAKALAPIGYALVSEFPGGAGFGEKGEADFWIGEGKPNQPPIHVAFHAGSRKLVDAFHAAALAAGGRDNGGPGLRPQYHPSYYGAFVLDPDGHNVEVVCHSP